MLSTTQHTTVPRLLVSILITTILLLGMSAGPASATHADDKQTHVHVDVASNGTATMDLVIAYDLETDEEQQAFQSLETDTATQTALADRYHERIAAVAADAENTSARNMTVSPATITLERSSDNTTGTVTLSVTWTNLAATTNNQLNITEPFASGFQTDHPFAFTIPPNYTAESTDRRQPPPLTTV